MVVLSGSLLLWHCRSDDLLFLLFAASGSGPHYGCGPHLHTESQRSSGSFSRRLKVDLKRTCANDRIYLFFWVTFKHGLLVDKEKMFMTKNFGSNIFWTQESVFLFNREHVRDNCKCECFLYWYRLWVWNNCLSNYFSTWIVSQDLLKCSLLKPISQFQATPVQHMAKLSAVWFCFDGNRPQPTFWQVHWRSAICIF